MYKDLFFQSPLLVLPVCAMFLFLAVYLLVAIRATTAPRADVEAAARLPLGDDHERADQAEGASPAKTAGEEAHVYDGIVELDNKLPLWWQLTLYGAVVFALIYWFGRRLDAIPTTAQTYAREMAAEQAAAAEAARRRGTIDDAALLVLSHDSTTVGKGHDIFASTCAPCHRLDAGGNIGPNLTDGYWIHGGRPTNIFQSVHEGVPAKGMPTWGTELGEERVETVVAYVLSIRDTNVQGGKGPQGEPESAQ